MTDYGYYEFWLVKGPKTRIEGKFIFLTYAFTGPRANEPNGLAVVRNYEIAIRKVGGTILQSDPERWVNTRIVQEGREAWSQIDEGNGKIWLRVIEKTEMEQHIVADAAAFGNDLRTTGHAAVFGIYFDTGKSAIKPESAQAIGEIARLLQANPGLKIYVVGHTDNRARSTATSDSPRTGPTPSSKRSSTSTGSPRAVSSPYGCGLFSPVASNDTEEGRAKNRRVELVKQ